MGPRSTDRWIDGSIDGSIDLSIDVSIDRSIDRSMAGSIDRWVDRLMDGWIDGSNARIDGLLVLVLLSLVFSFSPIFFLKLLGLTGYLFWCFFSGLDRSMGRMLGLTGYLFWWCYR